MKSLTLLMLSARALLFVLALNTSCEFMATAEPLKGKVEHEAVEPLKGKVEHESLEPLTGIVAPDGTSETIPAGIHFSETVDPVANDLKPHKLFSSITMPAEDNEDVWYQIPKWRAGMFHREKQTDHTQFGDVETVSKVDHLYGMQMDKKGGIWHHISWPKITKLTLDGYVQYKIINKYEPVPGGPNEFCVKVSSTCIDVDEKTGKIIRVGKQQEFDQYFPGGPGVANGLCLIKGFSSRGNANTTIEKTSVEEVQTKPFALLNTFRGKNLRESFCKYLEAHNMADLVPPPLK